MCHFYFYRKKELRIFCSLMKNTEEITNYSIAYNICTIFDYVKLQGTYTNSLFLLEQNINYFWTSNGKKSIREQHIWCDSLKRDNRAMCKCQTRSKNVLLTCLLHRYYLSVCIYLQNMFHNPGIMVYKDYKERKKLPTKLR